MAFRGASDRRSRAAKGYVQPEKLLVEPRQATCNHWLDLHGMQEVRGSNSLSSTFPQVKGMLRSLKRLLERLQPVTRSGLEPLVGAGADAGQAC